MEKKKALDSLNPIPNQQKNIDSLFAEAQYLNQEQSLALDDPSKMTEEIFNSIQLRRMEVGSALEDISTRYLFSGFCFIQNNPVFRYFCFLAKFLLYNTDIFIFKLYPYLQNDSVENGNEISESGTNLFVICSR